MSIKLIDCPSPDHENKFPSASINEETGDWRCFGCANAGNLKDGSVRPLSWMDKEPFAVKEGDTVVFSQFFGPQHVNLLRAIDVLPIMITVNGKVIKAEEKWAEVDDRQVLRMALTVSIWSDSIMHGTGMLEQYRFAEHGTDGTPVYTFLFDVNDRVAVVEDSNGAA